MEEYSGGVQTAVTVAGGLTTLDDDVISTRDTHNHSVDAAELHVEAQKITENHSHTQTQGPREYPTDTYVHST